MKHRLFPIFCLLATLAAPAVNLPAAAAPATTQTDSRPDILTLAAQTGHFKTLLDALDRADLLETLRQDGPYTLFAPNDAAFARLPQDELQRLLRDKRLLRRVLLHHVVTGQIDGDGVRRSDGFSSLSDEAIEIHEHVGEYYLDDVSRILRTDIEGRNGTLHEIDTVLIPPYRFTE